MEKNRNLCSLSDRHDRHAVPGNNYLQLFAPRSFDSADTQAPDPHCTPPLLLQGSCTPAPAGPPHQAPRPKGMFSAVCPGGLRNCVKRPTPVPERITLLPVIGLSSHAPASLNWATKMLEAPMSCLPPRCLWRHVLTVSTTIITPPCLCWSRGHTGYTAQCRTSDAYSPCSSTASILRSVSHVVLSWPHVFTPIPSSY